MVYADYLNLIEKILNDPVIHQEEIPNIPLYIDQLLTLFQDKLSEADMYDPRRELTKTMVNNYSKAGLLGKISGKKYSKEQMITILLICSLKRTLSIDEIKRLFSLTQGDIGPQLLERYVLGKDTVRQAVRSSQESIITQCGLQPEKAEDSLLGALFLTDMAGYLISIAQGLIELHAPDLPGKKQEPPKNSH